MALVVVFHEADAEQPIVTLMSDACPRQGEPVSITGQVWWVEHVAWAVDHVADPRGVYLRANVQLTKEAP